MPRIVSALAIATLVVSLTGCGAGLNASTRQISQVTDGVEATVKNDLSSIRVVNLLVVAAPGGNAVLVGTVVSTSVEEDTLLGVAISGTVATITGKIALLQNQPIIFEGDRANSKAVMPGFGAKAGTRVPVTLFFARAGEVTVDAIVRAAADEYAGITAAVAVPMATPSPTPTK